MPLPNEVPNTSLARLVAWRAAHPGYRQRTTERARLRYHTDPVCRARKLALNRMWSKRHRRSRRHQEAPRGA